MTVPREYTVNDFAINDTFAQATPTVGPGAVSGGNALLQGTASRTSTTIGRSATVKAGEDIRPALESLRSAGGGTLILLEGVHSVTYSLIGFTGLSVIGEGREKTIIDFLGTDAALTFIGTSGSQISNIYIKDLAIKNSSARAGLDIDFAFYVNIVNVFVEGCTNDGIYIGQSRWFDVSSCFSNSNGGNGYVIFGSATQSTFDFSFQNCRAYTNTASGFVVNAGATRIYFGSFLNCKATFNTAEGFDVNATFAGDLDIVFTNCTANVNDGIGFYVSVDAKAVSFLNCVTSGNLGDGFEMNGADFSILGGYSLEPVTLAAPGNMIGHSVSQETFVDSVTSGVSLNRNERPKEQYTIISMKNVSGSSLSTSGRVVVYGTDTNGLDCTTTTTVGDDRVCGVTTGTLFNNTIGPILTHGYTSQLRVNGVTDINVGDFLCTYSAAGIAAKAAAGDMVFARALGTYTTNDSNGIIAALLITPRKL